jgi:hypothetical protein
MITRAQLRQKISDSSLSSFESDPEFGSYFLHSNLSFLSNEIPPSSPEHSLNRTFDLDQSQISNGSLTPSLEYSTTSNHSFERIFHTMLTQIYP